MLCGEPPFNGGNDNEIYRSIQQREFTFREELWSDISSNAKNLIKKMLSDPEKRLTAQQVLDHPWLVKTLPQANVNLSNLNIKALKQYKKIHKLKKAILTFIASRLNDSEIAHLKEIFELFDKNKGTISLDEMKLGLTKLKSDKEKGKSNIKAEEIFKSINTNNTGKINYTEFIAASLDQKIYLKEERLYEAFRIFDKDNSGKISKDEIKKVLHLNCENDQSVDKLMKEFDLNGDGEIDYQEFLAMMKK